MDLDPKLVQRLTRPINQPGITNHRMADRLIDRAERWTNRLPLLDQQWARWATIADLDTEDIPIVYAQFGDAEPLAADGGLPTQPQRVQGDPATVPTREALPVAIAVPAQSSNPPDRSRVEPSQAPQTEAETGNPKTAIAPLATNQTTGVIQAKLETGATPAPPLAMGKEHNAIAPVQTAASLQSSTDSPIDQPSAIKNPAFDPQVMQAALSLDQPNLAPLPRDLPLAAMPPTVNQNELGHDELEDHRVSEISPSPAQSATVEILTTPLSPDSAHSDSMPLVQPSARSESAHSESARSKSARSKSARSEAAAPVVEAIAPLAANQTTGVIQAKLETGATPAQPLTLGKDHNAIAPIQAAASLQSAPNQTTGVIQAKLETGATPAQPLTMANTVQPLNGGADQSAKALHPPNTPNIQPQTAALPTIQSRPSTEAIIQAKFAAGAALPMVAPSEGLALSPNPSGFTFLNLAASNPIAAPLTTVPAGVTEPILTPFTPPRFPAVVSVPPLEPAPPPSAVLHARNFRAEQENPLAPAQQAIATVISRDGGDRKFAQHEPSPFSWVNRIEGDQADAAKGSGAIAASNPMSSASQTLPSHSKPGRDTSAPPALPSQIAQPIPPFRHPARDRQPGLDFRSGEVPPRPPTAPGRTAQAQPSPPASPQPAPALGLRQAYTNAQKPKPTIQHRVRPQGQQSPPTSTQPQNTPLPTVQAKTAFNPPNLEPLVLSGPVMRSHRTASSQETHRASQTHQQTPTRPVVISPALPNPPHPPISPTVRPPGHRQNPPQPQGKRKQPRPPSTSMTSWPKWSGKC